MQTPLETIRECDYLYMHSISEPEENALQLVLYVDLVKKMDTGYF